MVGSSLIIALTGASGISYGLSLLKKINVFKNKYSEVYVVYTFNAVKVALYEEGIDLLEFLKGLNGVKAVYPENDFSSELASSSNLVFTDMVIVPASMNTIAKIANGIQDNLVTRTASAVLRLRNKLVLVFRETPLSSIDLFNLYRLATAGAVVMPASPGFYIKPKSIEDTIDFIVGKILDALHVEHNLYKRWGIS
ncbi:UbiX family flavin prenyltransferase [Desulfurococcus amylolyticus]|uniref:Flavin prenyltransferase UbiX n=1 Tax=Desulfurococcus amylolyticus (strain DSM 18924 / JCM 16383 / VKM B-2413 / 1221n) TaxID=490899 RepID=B8D3A3_DESA1|nr:UbiX family flavin prenyltransferase [Desulfurococcus amylolyticus]ACL10374.1 3-octaprenyl-4-hydroxybenzoate carboxy-lyase [Desulfurococcus amylolyticus 1221n]